MTTGQLERWAVAEPIMAAKLNQPVDALLRQRGAGLPAEVMPAPRGAQPPAAVAQIGLFRVTQVVEDWVYATNLRTDEREVKIAKPYSLRRTPWSGTTIRIVYLDILVQYSYEPELITSDKRTATILGPDEEFTEIVIPQYRPSTGEIMLAAHVGLDTRIDPVWEVRWADLNVLARAWAVVPL